MKRIGLRALVGAVLTLALVACASGGGGRSATAAPTMVSSAAPAPIETSYRLGTGDKLRVITYGEVSLTGEFVVSSTGEIAMPLIGGVKVAGLTLPEVQSAIETPLRNGYLKDPHVSVEVLNFRPFYILGEVTKPGEYPYSSGLTILNAVATANGFTYRANTRIVLVKHASDAMEQEVELNPSILVRPGDTIRVKERYF